MGGDGDEMSTGEGDTRGAGSGGGAGPKMGEKEESALRTEVMNFTRM